MGRRETTGNGSFSVTKKGVAAPQNAKIWRYRCSGVEEGPSLLPLFLKKKKKKSPMINFFYFNSLDKYLMRLQTIICSHI